MLLTDEHRQTLFLLLVFFHGDLYVFVVHFELQLVSAVHCVAHLHVLCRVFVGLVVICDLELRLVVDYVVELQVEVIPLLRKPLLLAVVTCYFFHLGVAKHGLGLLERTVGQVEVSLDRKGVEEVVHDGFLLVQVHFFEWVEESLLHVIEHVDPD